MNARNPDFAERTFGIKAKPLVDDAHRLRHFAERTFGIKAKLNLPIAARPPYFAERTFGIKAKLARFIEAREEILPKEHLESRQSERAAQAS